MDPPDIALPALRPHSPKPPARSNPRSLNFALEAIEHGHAPVQTPSKKWDGIYPPVLPPPDFFHEEEEVEKHKEFFHNDEAFTNPLFDETGTVHLPHDEKGFLILDPASRCRLLDASAEYLTTLCQYRLWIALAVQEQQDLACERGFTWLEGLLKEVNYEEDEARAEKYIVDNEERVKRGISRTDKSWKTDLYELLNCKHYPNCSAWPTSDKRYHESGYGRSNTGPLVNNKRLYFKPGPMYIVADDELEDAVEASPQATPLTIALDNHATNNFFPTHDSGIQAGNPLSDEKEIEVESGSSTVGGKSSLKGEAESPHRKTLLALAVESLNIASFNSKLLQEEDSTAPPVDLMNLWW